MNVHGAERDQRLARAALGDCGGRALHLPALRDASDGERLGRVRSPPQMAQFGRQGLVGLMQRRELLEDSVLELVSEHSEVAVDRVDVVHGGSSRALAKNVLLSSG